MKKCNFCSTNKETENLQTFELEGETIQICKQCIVIHFSKKRDWNHYKSQFIYDRMNNAIHEMESLEEIFESPIERIMYHRLMDFAKSQYGAIYIECQVPIGKYFADFVVSYRPSEKKVVIECDGHEFHERTKEQVSRDKERDRYMTKQGFSVFRYSGTDILNNPQRAVNDIIEYFDAKRYMPVWDSLKPHFSLSGGKWDGEKTHD